MRVENSSPTLGEFLSKILSERDMAPAELKRKLQISSRLLDQLLTYGSKPGMRSPKPQVLRSIGAILDLDEGQLYRLAGYDIPETSFGPNDECDGLHLEETASLGAFLRSVLHARGMSGSLLAQLAGVSQGTISNLLRCGESDSGDGPRPQVLRAVCEVLGLDQVQVFQIAGYIGSEKKRPVSLSKCGEYVGRVFDNLPGDKQKVLLGTIKRWTGQDAESVSVCSPEETASQVDPA